MSSSYDEFIFTWGKYKGTTIGDVNRRHPQYLQWITTVDYLPEVWVEAAKRVLQNKDISDLALPRVKKSISPKLNYSISDSNIMVDLHDNKTAYIIMPYNRGSVEKLKYEIDGRTWNKNEGRWEFPAVHLTKVIEIFPTAILSKKASQLLDALVKRREDLDEIRGLDDTDFNINGLKLELYPFQKTGVKFIDRVGGRCLVADEPGLGKTAQAIAYSQLHGLKTLIVCPLSVVVNWEREILRFTGKKSTIWDTKGKIGSVQNRYHLIHYDAVGKVVDKLKKVEFDLLVCDEATYLKNRQTIRAKSILGSWKERKKYPGIKTKHVIFLTGTPVMSRPVEAFSLLNFLDKERFNNFYHFVQKYGGWQGQPPINLQELHQRTKDLVVRRTKKQVIMELPEKQRNDLYVELTTDEKKEYDKLLREMFGKWKTAGKPSVQHMPKLQGFLIDKKLPRLYEMIDEFLDNDIPILIFSCYLNPLKTIKEKYGDDAVLLTGEMNKKERHHSIDSLVNKTAKIGLFSLRAAGMGIDGLQNVIDTVVFIDMGWVPAEHGQAEDRTHRIGQKSQVQAYYMVCSGTIDEYMRDILKEKQEIADIIVDGALITPARNKSMFKEFVRRLNSKYNMSFNDKNIED
jgi:SWI/SNF-related matrix-associated actin-dependent regulator 1 of chromatin subfamily A